jgi:hypothetical protein
MHPDRVDGRRREPKPQLRRFQKLLDARIVRIAGLQLRETGRRFRPLPKSKMLQAFLIQRIIFHDVIYLCGITSRRTFP